MLRCRSESVYLYIKYGSRKFKHTNQHHQYVKGEPTWIHVFAGFGSCSVNRFNGTDDQKPIWTHERQNTLRPILYSLLSNEHAQNHQRLLVTNGDMYV